MKNTRPKCAVISSPGCSSPSSTPNSTSWRSSTSSAASLEDYQGHFAVYPNGAAYARHFDKLQGSDLRAISAALYLNDAWSAEDGGQLRMYLGGGRSEDVLPVGGRLVAFLSDRFEHEVLPARRERMSFTGWFRRRPLDGFV